MEIIFHSHANKTHFHKKGRASSLILKVRVFGTRKWHIYQRCYLPWFNLYFLFKGEGWQFVIWPIRVCAAEQGMVLRGLGLKKGFSVFNRMCCWTGSFWNVRSINLCYQQLFLTNQVPWSYFYKLLNSVSLRKRIRVIPIRSIVLNRVAKWTIFA